MPATGIVVLTLPGVHLLDLAGPVQVFWEANAFGADYRLRYCGTAPTVRTAQGLNLGELAPLPPVGARDLVLIPGIDSTTLDDLGHVPVDWLRTAAAVGARLCSICSGAFVLAHAGLLDGRRCTTHWKVVERLRQRHPRARVVDDRLFVQDGPVISSAGVSSGIDTALWIVERDCGAPVAARTAREIVVYLRRDGAQTQRSIYLEHRTHLHPGVHRVQDWLIAHPERKPTIEQLSRIAAMSPRNLTRVFRRTTGVTLKAFSDRLKLEVAGNLLQGTDLSVDDVALRCGFRDSRQLRRLWQRSFGESPSTWRERAPSSAAGI